MEILITFDYTYLFAYTNTLPVNYEAYKENVIVCREYCLHGSARSIPPNVSQ